MTTKTWSTAASGNWNVAANWTGGVPGSNDTADLNSLLTGAYTVSITDAESVDTVLIDNTNATLAIATGALLTPNVVELNAGTLSLSGRLLNADVIDNGGSFVANNGTLDGVTWQGVLTVQTNGVLFVHNGITVTNLAATASGTIALTNANSALEFTDVTTLDAAFTSPPDPGLVIDIGTTGSTDSIYGPASGALTIGAHASVVQQGSGTSTDAQFDGATLVNDGTITLEANQATFQFFTANTVNAGTIQIGAQETVDTYYIAFTNSGSVSVDAGSTFTVNSGTVSDTGTISVTNGSTVDVVSNMTGPGLVNLSGSSHAELQNFASGTVDFLDQRDTLQLDVPGSFTGSIEGWTKATVGVNKDTIDLRGVATVTGFNYVPNGGSPTTGGVLQVLNGGSIVASLNLIGNYTTATYSFTSDGFSSNPGTNIFTSQTACFLAGTSILTDRGEVSVEDLREGDRVATRAPAGEPTGATFQPVRWIGVSTVDLDRHPRPHLATPVRVVAGAFGPGLPARDLLLSPDHALFVPRDTRGRSVGDGVLVPAGRLVNGASVRRERIGGVIRYYHVELDRHAVLFANGMPAESYLDTGNRADFDNGGDVRSLYPMSRDPIARRSLSPDAVHEHAWTKLACAELVTAGTRLRGIRARLGVRLASLGFVVTLDAALAVEADGQPLAMTATPTGWICMVPPRTRAVRLRSRSRIPDEHDRTADDARRLGIPLAALRHRGQEIGLDAPELVAGFHAPEPGLRWTDGDAELRLTQHNFRTTLEIHVAPLPTQYWATPSEIAAGPAIAVPANESLQAVPTEHRAG